MVPTMDTLDMMDTMDMVKSQSVNASLVSTLSIVPQMIK